MFAQHAEALGQCLLLLTTEEGQPALRLFTLKGETAVKQGQTSKTITDEIKALEERTESCEGGEVESLHTLPAVQAQSEPQEETARSGPMLGWKGGPVFPPPWICVCLGSRLSCYLALCVLIILFVCARPAFHPDQDPF